MSNGSGWLVMDILMILLCILAATLQLAIFMDRTKPESKLMDSGRIVLFTGYSILTVRFAFHLVSFNDILIPPVTEVGIALLAAGHICFALNRFKA